MAPISVRPLAAEHRRLLADVDPHLRGLGSARPGRPAEQPDLTLLQEATGWDARLVALAASADHVTAADRGAATAAYALLRGGLPGDPAGLAGVEPCPPSTGRWPGDSRRRGDRTRTTGRPRRWRRSRRSPGAPGCRPSRRGRCPARARCWPRPGCAPTRPPFDEIYHANAHAGAARPSCGRAGEGGRPAGGGLQPDRQARPTHPEQRRLTTDLQKALTGDLGPATGVRRVLPAEAWVRAGSPTPPVGARRLAALVPPAYRSGSGDGCPGLRRRAGPQGAGGLPDQRRRPAGPHGRAAAAGHRPGRARPRRRLPGPGRRPGGCAGSGLGVGAAGRAWRRSCWPGCRTSIGSPSPTGCETLQRTYQITPTDAAMTVLLSRDCARRTT